jgi:DnaJ-domain-containing protein 1
MKKGFLDGYKTYNSQDGFGNPSDWRRRFRERMGYKEARDYLSQRAMTPFDVLKVPESSTWEEIKSAFRKLIFEHHPDRGGSKEKAQEIIAAYSILEKEYGH